MIFETLTELFQQQAEKRALERKRIDCIRADIERQALKACEQEWKRLVDNLKEINNE